MTVRKVCPCGLSFDARSPNAKWCSPGCQKRHLTAAKAARAAGEVPESAAANPPTKTSAQQRRDSVGKAGDRVLKATRAELKTLGSLDSLEGTQAILLATRIADPGETGASVGRLVAELRALMVELRAARPAADPVSAAQGQLYALHGERLA